MINLKKLRTNLETQIMLAEMDKGKRLDRKKISKRITIKRKKKMILEKMSNGNVRTVRRNYLKIEIIE